MRKIIFTFFLILFFLFIPKPAYAEGEFSSSYDVTYEVLDSGITKITEKVTLKNLTDRYFASSFNLTIAATEISQVSASDNQGALKTEVSKSGKKTDIKVNFNQQILGKDKEYIFVLDFTSHDFAQKQGKIWQVSVPKIASGADIDNYYLTLLVPVSFGDPTSLIPEPISQSENAGKIQFKFTREQLSSSGILANFGSEQLFDFNLTYNLYNPNILPAVAKLILPSDTQYQQILINNINPKPEDVTIDADGNYVGYFKLSKKQNLDVKVSGIAKLFISPNYKIKQLSQKDQQTYTSNQQYWDKNNPVVKEKSTEILREIKGNSTREKAQAINKFVVSLLKYDESRLNKKDFERLGGATILTNPDKALCSEFTDLFISLARAANIPARENFGYAYTSNTLLRPLSLDKNVLHAWPEYFDPSIGWVMIDPTWENTTGGVDYFSKFDLNHFTLGKSGFSSESPSLADDTNVNFSNSEFKKRAELKLNIDAPREIFAIFPAKVKVKIENLGNSLETEKNLSFTSSKLQIPGNNSFVIPKLAPFASFEYEFNVKSSSPFESYEDVLQLKVGDKVINKLIQVKPFFAYNYFSYAVIGFTVTIVLIYGGILFLHLRKAKVTDIKLKK